MKDPTMQPVTRSAQTQPTALAARPLAALLAIGAVGFLLVQPLAGCESGSRKPASERQSSDKARSNKERPKWNDRSDATSANGPLHARPVYSVVHA